MHKWAKIFWLLFLFDSITTGLKLLSYLVSVENIYFKIPAILFFIFLLIFHSKYPIKYSEVTRIFIFAGVLAVIIGLVTNMSTMDLKIISQLYGIIMPVLSVSFGLYYAQYIGWEITKDVRKFFVLYIYLNIVFLSIYFYLHYFQNQIPYFGFQVGWQYVSAYFIAQVKPIFYLLGITLVVLSGKRATLVTSIIPFLAYMKHGFVYGNKKILSSIFVVVTMAIIFSGILYSDGYFRRVESTLSFDFKDERSTFLATSGRWQEVESVVRHMNDNPVSWLIGNGIGSKYLWVVDVKGFAYFAELKHYAHITPVSYVFLHGLLLTIAIFYYLFYLIYRGWKSYSMNFFYLCFLVSIIGSLFGANLAVDSKIWFFVGVVSGMIKFK